MKDGDRFRFCITRRSSEGLFDGQAGLQEDSELACEQGAVFLGYPPLSTATYSNAAIASLLAADAEDFGYAGLA